MDIAIGRKRFVTPSKTMKSPLDMHLLEIYQRANENMIKTSRQGRTELDLLPRRCKDNTINVIIPEYVDVGIEDRSLQDLESRIHPHTDIMIVPRWNGILRSNKDSTLSESLWNMSDRYIEEIRRINGKLIMGNIPMSCPQSVIENLVDKYIKKDITSFVLDYGACQAPGKAHIVRNITKKLINDGFRDDSVLYHINMRRSHDYGGVKPADDFLSFIQGFDILGNSYMKGGGGKQNIIKIFDPRHWTYFDSPLDGRDKNEIYHNNNVMMNEEAAAVKMNMQEYGSSLDLVKTKKGAFEHTNVMAQTTLDFCGIRWG